LRIAFKHEAELKGTDFFLIFMLKLNHRLGLDISLNEIYKND